MASQSRAPGEDLVIPVVATLAVHAMLAVGLIIVGWFVHREPPLPDDDDDEVEIERPRPKAATELPRPEPVVPKVVMPEPPKIEQPVKPVRTERVARAAVTPTPEVKPTTEPAAGQEGVPMQGDPIVLPDVFVTGDVEVGRGTRQGSGGAGGPGPGNKPQGEGGTAPAPVSIAAIKKRAMPIGDTGYQLTRDYPEEARKLGIGGTVKVRLLVDDQGKVTRRTLIKKVGHGLDERAMELAGKLRFQPAVDAADRPVASIVVWAFDFYPPE